MFGADHTSGPLRWLFESIFGRVSNARWAILHHYIRKSGHFFWLWIHRAGVAARMVDDSAALSLPSRRIYSHCWAQRWWPACDEWHQTFLPNRTGTPWDVLLDCCGAITLQLAGLCLSCGPSGRSGWLGRRNSLFAAKPNSTQNTGTSAVADALACVI